MSNGVAERQRQHIRAFMEARGLKMLPWAKAAKLSEGALRNFLEGRSKSLHRDTLVKLARAAGVAAWQITGDEPQPAPLVSIVGYVGAGASIFPFDDHEMGGGFDEVPAPPDLEGGVAVRIRGDSMYPAYDDGDVLVYHRTHDFEAAECLGRRCVVKVKDGPTLIKRIAKGTRVNRWRLVSHNAPDIEDVEIEWAAPVRWVRQG